MSSKIMMDKGKNDKTCGGQTQREGPKSILNKKSNIICYDIF